MLFHVIMKLSSYDRIELQSLGGYIHTLSFQLPCFNTLSNKLSCNLISHTSNLPGNCFRDMTGTGQVKGKVITSPLKIISFMYKIYFGFIQALDALNNSRYSSSQDDPFTLLQNIEPEYAMRQIFDRFSSVSISLRLGKIPSRFRPLVTRYITVWCFPVSSCESSWEVW